jgi:Holliday junction resolvasome RuvABC endonuclease subunit
MPGTLLSLDLSGGVGWCLLRPPPAPARFGQLAWRGDGSSLVCARFSDWLRDFYSVERWDAMAWEEPWLRPGDKPETIKILFGLVGVALAFAGSARHPMPFRTITPRQVKKYMTGNSYADKEAVIAACWKLGLKVGSSDAADACGVGLALYDEIWPEARAA